MGVTEVFGKLKLPPRREGGISYLENMMLMRKERLAELHVADSIESQAIQLEAYADEFARLANSPQQMRLAARFRNFVHEMTSLRGTEPEKRKEPIKDRNHAR